MFYENEIVRGEQLQQIADVYIGSPADFEYNPLIAAETNKHLDISAICFPFRNPAVVFCYGHLVGVLATRVRFFRNPFVLITHNSDENIVATPDILTIVNCPMVKKWYAQNVAIDHPKLVALPIGFANSQWRHGDTSFFRNPARAIQCHCAKTERVYFCFQLHTNFAKRDECYKSLRDKLPFLPIVDPTEYHETLSKYEFCICPEGNGADTHRFWEALYLKCVPIVVRTPYITILQKQYPHLPMVVFDSWADFQLETLHYDMAKMASPDYYQTLVLSYFIFKIRESSSSSSSSSTII